MYVRERAPNRPHTTNVAHDIINRRTCLHVDAWLYESEAGELFLLVEYSVAGKQLLYRPAYRIDRIGLGPHEPIPIDPREQNFAAMRTRYIDGPWARQRAPYLEDVHRKHILPMIHREYAGAGSFRGYRSIALWYVFSDPTISDPLAGIENVYDTTHRALRGKWSDTPAMPAPSILAKPKRPRLNDKDRSIMRTLDKLL